jgi:hypothetical protein
MHLSSQCAVRAIAFPVDVTNVGIVFLTRRVLVGANQPLILRSVLLGKVAFQCTADTGIRETQ